ncbi:Uu.00g037370.m01.CDS01, partial [Anthostomella pinea]
EICIAGLKGINVAANVTGRVKTDDSLTKKLRRRSSLKPYCDHESIMDNKLDFVGLRIALYFPDQEDRVIQMLKKKFLFESMRPFDRDWKPHEPGIYQNTFGQYVADHVWVSLYESDRGPAGKYADYRFEIQLRSVLMDAWAGISHDLQYEAHSGYLTVTELKFLHALKGHVEVGEMMLEQLHRVHLKRIETENETICTLRELREVLINSVPEYQLANCQIGDLDALLIVLKATHADTPRTFRRLLQRFDVKTQLCEDLEQWRHSFQPIPTTVAFYLLQRALPTVSTQPEEFCDVARRVREHHPRLWYDSRYWQPLLWLSRELLRLSELGNPYLENSHIRVYAHIWCAEFYLKTNTPTTPDDTCVVDCLSRTGECSAPGLQFFTELCILGLAPTATEYRYEQEHDEPDYEDDRFKLIAVLMIRMYTLDPQAWLQAVYDYKTSLWSWAAMVTDAFFRSADIALWLMSLREQDLLEQLLRHWPFQGRRSGDEAHGCWARICSLAKSHQDKGMFRLLQGDEKERRTPVRSRVSDFKKGYHMLDLKSIKAPELGARRVRSMIHPQRRNTARNTVEG